jgi:hypothetical protein
VVNYGDERLRIEIGGGKARIVFKNRATERDVEKKVL